jgi:hypothetical protein
MKSINNKIFAFAIAMGFSITLQAQQEGRKGLNAVNVKIAKVDSVSVEGTSTNSQKKGYDYYKAQSNMTSSNSKSGINNINGGMPNRISMNVTVPKQTQGATFGEKVNQGLSVVLVEDGCVVLFSSKEGYRIRTAEKSIEDLSSADAQKVNQGLHAAGGALAQGASLLGGAIPGGAIISAAVSSVGNLAGGAGGGAAAASYAKTASSGKGKVYKIQDADTDTTLDLVDGEYELSFKIVEKSVGGVKDTMQTQVKIGFTVDNNVLKTKHDTVKNSVSNIR